MKILLLLIRLGAGEMLSGQSLSTIFQDGNARSCLVSIMAG
jgi:hypothetical protein